MGVIEWGAKWGVGCYPGAIAPELAHSAATGGVVGNEREAIAYSMAKL